MTRNDEPRSDIRPITIRLPQRDYMLLREYARKRNLSMNSVISEAIAEYGVRIERKQSLERIHFLQQQLRQRRNPGIDSVGLLCKMREVRTQHSGSQTEGSNDGLP